MRRKSSTAEWAKTAILVNRSQYRLEQTKLVNCAGNTEHPHACAYMCPCPALPLNGTITPAPQGQYSTYNCSKNFEPYLR